MINNKRLQAAEGGTEMSFSLKTLCMAGILAAAALPPAAAQEVALRIHHFLPPQAPVPANFIAPWAEKVPRESGGRIAFAIYPSMPPGVSPPAPYDQARAGVVDLTWTLHASPPAPSPATQA